MGGRAWTAAEDKAVVQTGISLEQIAEQLGRTYAAVANRRQMLRHHVLVGVRPPINRSTWLIAKSCAVCGELRPREAFLGANGWLRSECRECSIAYAHAYRETSQTESLPDAARRYGRWTREDEAIAFARDANGRWTRTAAEAARLIGRTYGAVQGARTRWAKKYPLTPASDSE